MKRKAAARLTRRVYVSLIVLLGVGLPAGWLGGHFLNDAHLREVTGRADPPELNCFFCHRRIERPPTRGESTGPGYLSPAGLAVSPGGRRLFVAAEGADRLLVVDLGRREIERLIEVEGAPHGVAISADGGRVAVSCRDLDRVQILDGETLELLETVAAGPEPLGLALSPDGRQLYVANGRGQDLAAVDLGPGGGNAHLSGGNEPYAVDLSPDGRLLALANRRVTPRPEPALPLSEVTLIDASANRVLDRRMLASAHLAEGVAVSSDRSFVLVPVLRVRNYLPTTQVARGALMNSALAFIETRPGGRTVQFPLDEVNAYFADPSDVVLTPDDRLAFVTHGGARRVTAVDARALQRLALEADVETLETLAEDLGAFSEYVLARIPTLDNPRALAVSPDGAYIYVAERLADSIAVIDTRELRLVDRIDLGGPKEVTAERRGERVFHDASGTFQGQFSCRSCHPDGHTDGLNWDFEIDGVGQHRLDTRSLRGIRDTPPFKWNGKNPDLATQCGPRFARVLTRAEPFKPRDLQDLVSYIESLPLPPRAEAAELAAARERGWQVFFRERTASGDPIPVANRCPTCHPPPLYTDRLMSDVGTGGLFDNPHLLDVASSPPYLHDGRSPTLEEIWTVHNPEDTHGATNDLSKVELNDLIAFLKSL